MTQRMRDDEIQLVSEFGRLDRECLDDLCKAIQALDTVVRLREAPDISATTQSSLDRAEEFLNECIDRQIRSSGTMKSAVIAIADKYRD